LTKVPPNDGSRDQAAEDHEPEDNDDPVPPRGECAEPFEQVV